MIRFLKRGKDVTKEWAAHEIPCDEPTVHRLRVLELDAGTPTVVAVPLLGRGATAGGKWLDGKPVRIVALKVPAKEPERRESWRPRVLSQQLRAVQGVDVCYQVYSNPKEVASIMTASSAGVHALWTTNGAVTQHNPIALYDKDKPDGAKPARSVCCGCLRSRPFLRRPCMRSQYSHQPFPQASRSWRPPAS